MRMTATFQLAAVALAGLAWAATPAEAARSCSNAYNECKAFCASSGSGQGCLSICQNRYNSCKRTGTFIWTTRPVEKGLEKR